MGGFGHRQRARGALGLALEADGAPGAAWRGEGTVRGGRIRGELGMRGRRGGAAMCPVPLLGPTPSPNLPKLTAWQNSQAQSSACRPYAAPPCRAYSSRRRCAPKKVWSRHSEPSSAAAAAGDSNSCQSGGAASKVWSSLRQMAAAARRRRAEHSAAQGSTAQHSAAQGRRTMKANPLHRCVVWWRGSRISRTPETGSNRARKSPSCASSGRPCRAWRGSGWQRVGAMLWWVAGSSQRAGMLQGCVASRAPLHPPTWPGTAPSLPAPRCAAQPRADPPPRPRCTAPGPIPRPCRLRGGAHGRRAGLGGPAGRPQRRVAGAAGRSVLQAGGQEQAGRRAHS